MQNNGLFLILTDSSTIADVNSSNNSYGIALYFSSNNTTVGNTTNLNRYIGIWIVFSSERNTLTGNTVTSNGDYGIVLGDFGGFTAVFNNSNKVYNNNLVDNPIQIYVGAQNTDNILISKSRLAETTTAISTLLQKVAQIPTPMAFVTPRMYL